MISNQQVQSEVCVLNAQDFDPTNHMNQPVQDFPMMKKEQLEQDSNYSSEPSQPSPQPNSEKFYLFSNQVGGHNPLLKPIDDSRNYIVKPAQTIEVDFYQQMKENKDLQKLEKFVPKFFGTVEITNPSQILIANDQQSNKVKNCSDSLEHLNQEYKSSWIQGLFQRRFKYGQYIKLEDLTYNKKYPCILDLKMGFSAIEEKDTMKFQNSTSSSLGFRLCGMNVYYPLNKNAIFRDKYWGRNITDETLKICIQSFFYDGEQLRTGLVQSFIDQLKELKDVVFNLKGHKFISSSILLIFDANYKAEDFSTNKKGKQSSKFSSQQKENNPMEKSQSIDSNIIYTQDSKISTLDNVSLRDFRVEQSFDQFSDNLNNSYMSEESNNNFDNNFLKQENSQKSITSSHSDDCLSFKQSKPHQHIKLIDFANIEVDQNDDKPDQELLQGLENLINIFEEIKSQNISQEFLVENQKLIQSKESDELKKVNEKKKKINQLITTFNH